MGRFFKIPGEVGHINMGITEFQETVGQQVLWYEWSEMEAATDDETDIYDEGTAANPRRWLPPKSIPTFTIIRQEGEERPGPEGFYTVDTIHFSALLEQLRERDLRDPHDAQRHLHDRIVWDKFVWEIRRYQIAGRVQNHEVVVGVDATRLRSEEMVNDPDFATFTGAAPVIDETAWTLWYGGY